MLDIGSQILFCDAPLRLDTYKGCAHACGYCFAKRKTGIEEVEIDNCYGAVLNFLDKKYTNKTKLTKGITPPIHWGGMSDPLQPIEKEKRISLKILKLLAERKYPFVISTKALWWLDDPEYVEAFKNSNCVYQISMICSGYDEFETGAPNYEERLAALPKIQKLCKRLIIRMQPFNPAYEKEAIENIKKYKDIAYGLVFEGLKIPQSFGKRLGMVKIGGDYAFSCKTLLSSLLKIREECHNQGLKFFSGENRLRNYGDSLCCCGFDGLEGFDSFQYNIMHLKYKQQKCHPGMGEMAEAMSSFYQNGKATSDALKKVTMKQFIDFQFERLQNNPQFFSPHS